jgi:hypothetical protein
MKAPRSKFKRRLKLAKVLFSLAALFFVAKPFLAFSLFNQSHQPSQQSIFVKSFTKRKLEYVKDSKFDIAVVQKKLADPACKSLFGFFFFLSILFPLISETVSGITDRFLRRIKLSLVPAQDTWLRNGQFII